MIAANRVRPQGLAHLPRLLASASSLLGVGRDDL
jgi:hypothetical protein